MPDAIDFVAVGDITTDAFIKLKDASVNCEINRDTCMLCVRFGDKIPYEDLTIVPAVGNSPNASVSACRLGLSSALATNLGDDAYGKEDIDTLRKEGVITDFIRVHEGMQSNYHFVLRYEEERTILVKHYEYDYRLPEFPQTPAWLYLSSLGENSLPFHHEIARYVKESGARLAFQPGTFQIKLGYEQLKDVYEASELFFCNKQEAKNILGLHEENNVQALLKSMRERGPKIVVITDGPDGANVYDGNEMWHMPMYPDPAPPVDRTGAGDSFSSTFTSMLALGKSIPEALERAPINSMSVVQYIGAQKGLLSLEKIEEYLVQAPEEYKPTQIA